MNYRTFQDEQLQAGNNNNMEANPMRQGIINGILNRLDIINVQNNQANPIEEEIQRQARAADELRAQQRNVMIADIMGQSQTPMYSDSSKEEKKQHYQDLQFDQEANLPDIPVLAKRSSSVNSHLRKQREDMEKECIMMGFNAEAVEYAAIKVNHRGVEHIIDYLTGKDETDGKFTHDFVQMPGDLDEICLLCQENIYQHRFEQNNIIEEEFNQEQLLLQMQLIRQKSNAIAQNFEQEVNREIKPTEKLCDVCYETKPENLFISTQNCEHIFCIDCTREHIKQLILNAKVLKIKCCEHQCEILYRDEDVEKILSGTGDKKNDEMYIKYLKFKQIKILDADPLVRWCPKPGCEKFVRGESRFTKKLTCQCGQDICFKCGRVFHGFIFTSCDNQIDVEFNQWAKGKEIRICPMCKAHIEKSEGCNHMTCYYCDFQFCWICGDTYSYDHYQPFNPFGCGGQQFSQADPATSFFRFIWLYTRRLLILIVILLLGPVALVLAIPVVMCIGWFQLTSKCFGYNRYFMHCCFFLITMAPIFAIGLALDIICAPLAIIIGIPFFIIYQIMGKLETKRLARLRLKDRLNQALQLQAQIDSIKEAQVAKRRQSISSKRSNEIRIIEE